MSIVNWEDHKYYKCPHCEGVLDLEIQDSEGYGTNSWLINPLDKDFCEEISFKQAEKLIKKQRDDD